MKLRRKRVGWMDGFKLFILKMFKLHILTEKDSIRREHLDSELQPSVRNRNTCQYDAGRCIILLNQHSETVSTQTFMKVRLIAGLLSWTALVLSSCT